VEWHPALDGTLRLLYKREAFSDFVLCDMKNLTRQKKVNILEIASLLLEKHCQLVHACFVVSPGYLNSINHQLVPA
jgi:hypothetical protein